MTYEELIYLIITVIAGIIWLIFIILAIVMWVRFWYLTKYALEELEIRKSEREVNEQLKAMRRAKERQEQEELEMRKSERHSNEEEEFKRIAREKQERAEV
ncbi:MAG: hypothetical protein ACRDCF_01455 [Mycoplasmoidaceae bacterium]